MVWHVKSNINNFCSGQTFGRNSCVQLLHLPASTCLVGLKHIERAFEFKIYLTKKKAVKFMSERVFLTLGPMYCRKVSFNILKFSLILFSFPIPAIKWRKHSTLNILPMNFYDMTKTTPNCLPQVVYTRDDTGTLCTRKNIQKGHLCLFSFDFLYSVTLYWNINCEIVCHWKANWHFHYRNVVEKLPS